MAQRLKCLPAVWKTWVRSLGREDPLEREMATHSSSLASRIPWMEEPGGLQSMGSQRVRHNLSNFAFTVTDFLYILDCKSAFFLFLLLFGRSVMSDCLQPHRLRTPGFSVLHCLPGSLKVMSIESMMPSSHLRLLLPSPPAHNLSKHQGLF